LSFTPASLDYADLAPDRLVEMVLRHRDLKSVLPFQGWWQNPITAVFSVRGCRHDCATCGNSRSGSERLSARHSTIQRSPENLVKNVVAISRLSRGPIFLVGDLRQMGRSYARQVLELLREANPDNEIIFELFDMSATDYLREIDRSVRNWSLELSPESHDPAIRHAQEGYSAYTNEEMEEVIREALALRCHRVDVFFMIGLSGQDRSSVMESIDYCEHLLRSFDSRVSCFISPMGPFLDPASRAFEDPAAHGYRLFAHTLEEHRKLLEQPAWSQVLNYETVWMSRAELAAVTYEAGLALNALKRAYGRLDAQKADEIAQRIEAARALQEQIASSGAEPVPEAAARLLGQVEELSVSTVCDKRELFWSTRHVNFHLLEILRIGLRSLLPSRLRRGQGAAPPAAMGGASQPARPRDVHQER
jgi:B12-binding domain/radical SAM domain protein